MSNLYRHQLTDALHRHLTGEVEVSACTLVAIRLQETVRGHGAVHPDDVASLTSSRDGLTISWRHERRLPVGTVAWRSCNRFQMHAVASLLMHDAET